MIKSLGIPTPPETSPWMKQTWEDLLFLHWPIDADLLAQHLPDGLSLDTWEGQGWIGVTPFAVTELRLRHLPSLPGASSFHELNVRTYVHHGDVAGVWFMSLDASKTLPVIGAKTAYALPYCKADIEFTRSPERLRFCSRRTGQADCEFEAAWRPVGMAREAAPDSIEHFLIERYWLYAASHGGLCRARIHHPPWQLRAVDLEFCRSSLIGRHGLPEPDGLPLQHCAARQDVDVWSLERL